MGRELVTNGKANYGTYHEMIDRLNLLDRKVGIPKAVKQLRLKEWQAIQVFNDDFFMISAILNAKSIGVIQTLIIDRTKQTKHHIHKKVYYKNVEISPSLYNSETVYIDEEHRIRLKNMAETKSFDVDIHHLAQGVHLTGSGHLIGIPLTIYYPFDNDNSLYTCKMVMPFDAKLQLGEKIFSNESIMIIDDHKGFYPYHMKYQWATAAMMIDKTIYAFNFTHNDLKDGHIHNENVVWIGKEIHHFGEIHIKYNKTAWHIIDDEGRVNLTFTPEYDYEEHKNYGLIQTNYISPIGVFNGTIKLKDGQVIKVDNWYGMTEDINHRI